MNGWMHTRVRGWMGEWAEDKRVDVWIYGCMMYTLMDRQVGKLTGGCMEGWKDVWEDGWMDRSVDRKE